MPMQGIYNLSPESQQGFEAFCLDRRVLGVRPKTLRWYTTSLVPFLRAVGPTPTTSAVFGYLDSLRGRVAPASYHSYTRAIRAFLRWAHQEGRLPEIKVPVPAWPRLLPPTYSREEVALILGHINRRQWIGQRDYLMIHVLWDCGLRAGEICVLRRTDVLLTARVLRVNGKGGKEEFVPYSPTIASLLKAWLRGHAGLPTDYLFPSRKGPHLTTNGLHDMILARTTAVGVRVRRAVHAWRHTCAVHSWENGADIADLKDLLRHSSFQTVEIYRHATVKAKRERHDRYSPVERD